MVKPDGVQRGLVGEVIRRFERKGLKLIAMKFTFPTVEIASKHYEEHVGKPFYEGLISFITSGPTVPMVWEGNDAVHQVRNILGVTNPKDATPGSIRGDFGLDMGRNVVHASSDVEAGKFEIGVWFSEEEQVGWDYDSHRWVLE